MWIYYSDGFSQNTYTFPNMVLVGSGVMRQTMIDVDGSPTVLVFKSLNSPFEET